MTFWYSSFHFYLSLTGKDEISTLLITFNATFQKISADYTENRALTRIHIRLNGELTTLLIMIYINFRKYRETISAQVSFSVHMGVARREEFAVLMWKNRS